MLAALRLTSAPAASESAIDLRSSWVRMLVAVELADLSADSFTGLITEQQDALLQRVRQLHAYVIFLASADSVEEEDSRRLESLIQALLVQAKEAHQQNDLPVGDAAPGTTSDNTLTSIAADYGVDAVQERKIAIVFQGMTVVAGLSFAGALFWGLWVMRADDAGLEAYWPYVIFSAAPAVLAILCFWLSERYRRSAVESRRLQRQIETLNPYLLGLTPAVADLLRASLAPRLFSRTLDDNDPLREPLWPAAGDFVEILRPSTSADDGRAEDTRTPENFVSYFSRFKSR
jgi:hypothetical protein